MNSHELERALRRTLRAGPRPLRPEAQERARAALLASLPSPRRRRRPRLITSVAIGAAVLAIGGTALGVTRDLWISSPSMGEPILQARTMGYEFALAPTKGMGGEDWLCFRATHLTTGGGAIACGDRERMLRDGAWFTARSGKRIRVTGFAPERITAVSLGDTRVSLSSQRFYTITGTKTDTFRQYEGKRVVRSDPPRTPKP